MFLVGILKLSLQLSNAWNTLVSTKHTNCKANIWPRTCLSIHQTPNNRCIKDIFHLFLFQIILWTLHETKLVSFLYWNLTTRSLIYCSSWFFWVFTTYGTTTLDKEVLVIGTCTLTSLISTFREASLPLVSPFSMNRTF